MATNPYKHETRVKRAENHKKQKTLAFLTWKIS